MKYFTDKKFLGVVAALGVIAGMYFGYTLVNDDASFYGVIEGETTKVQDTTIPTTGTVPAVTIEKETTEQVNPTSVITNPVLNEDQIVNGATDDSVETGDSTKTETTTE